MNADFAANRQIPAAFTESSQEEMNFKNKIQCVVTNWSFRSDTAQAKHAVICSANSAVMELRAADLQSEFQRGSIAHGDR